MPQKKIFLSWMGGEVEVERIIKKIRSYEAHSLNVGHQCGPIVVYEVVVDGLGQNVGVCQKCTGSFTPVFVNAAPSPRISRIS